MFYYEKLLYGQFVFTVNTDLFVQNWLHYRIICSCTLLVGTQTPSNKAPRFTPCSNENPLLQKFTELNLSFMQRRGIGRIGPITAKFRFNQTVRPQHQNRSVVLQMKHAGRRTEAANPRAFILSISPKRHKILLKQRFQIPRNDSTKVAETVLFVT
jgi:hypothetical protein